MKALPLYQEPFRERWTRRAISLSSYLILFVLYVALFPVVLPLVLILDVVRPEAKFSATRMMVFLGIYLAAEIVVMVWTTFHLFYGPPDSERYLAAHYKAQYMFLSGMFHLGMWLFNVKMRIDDLEAAREGPYILMVRHASIADALLPNAILPRYFPLRLRVILKHELLRDPAVDIVGCRIPNAFVKRGGYDTQKAVNHIRSLVDGISPRELILLFPEGTRFSKKRQQRILTKLEASGDPEIYEMAKSLKRLLPPHLAGVLGLLDASDNKLDAVFCAHTGFDGVRRLSDFWNGKLVGREVHIQFWRVPAKDIPKTEAERIRWIYGEWQKVDNWVVQHTEEAWVTRDLPRPGRSSWSGIEAEVVRNVVKGEDVGDALAEADAPDSTDSEKAPADAPNSTDSTADETKSDAQPTPEAAPKPADGVATSTPKSEPVPENTSESEPVPENTPKSEPVPVVKPRGGGSVLSVDLSKVEDAD